MKKHSDYPKNIFADSEIATLILVGMCENGLELKDIGMHGDGLYYLRVCDKEVEIPEYYEKVFECRNWLKIYDDHKLAYDSNYDHNRFVVYRAGMTITIKAWSETRK